MAKNNLKEANFFKVVMLTILIVVVVLVLLPIVATYTMGLSGFTVTQLCDEVSLRGAVCAGTQTLQSVTDSGSHTTNAIQTGGIDLVTGAGIVPFTATVGGTEVARIWAKGHMQNLDGYSTESPQYGPALVTYDYGQSGPVRTDGTGSFDLTGNPNGDDIFTRSTGTQFQASDVTNGYWIVLWGADFGAYARIIRYIDGDNVQLETMGWDKDFPVQSYYVFNSPTFTTGYNGRTELLVQNGVGVEFYTRNYTGDALLKLDMESNNGEGQAAERIEVDANGRDRILGQSIYYVTGTMPANTSGAGLYIQINESEATTSGTSTLLAGAAFATTDETDAIKTAVTVLPGFDYALEVSGQTSSLPKYGYEVATGVVTDRVNSGGGGNDAFVNPNVNVTIFDSNNDYILIGNDQPFEICEVILESYASKSINPVFYYSSGTSAWSSLTIISDATNGFQQTGQIIWDAPGDWADIDEAEAPGDITKAYYIKIERDVVSVPTPPTERIFNIYLERTGATGMEIQGTGILRLPYITAAPGTPVNGMIWMESDGLHIYYNNTEKVVAGV